MFTGIIEDLGLIRSVEQVGSNLTFSVSSSISSELKVDQSISHNGVCLTVESLDEGSHSLTAIQETLEKTNLSELQLGSWVNLERCLMVNSRLDGHMVQGHVDGIGGLLNVQEMDGSWKLSFGFDKSFAHLLVEKGSVCINGVSLTAFDVSLESFSVAIIPYTWEHTNLSKLKVGGSVNLEFDILGKYAARFREVQDRSSMSS